MSIMYNMEYDPVQVQIDIIRKTIDSYKRRLIDPFGSGNSSEDKFIMERIEREERELQKLKEKHSEYFI